MRAATALLSLQSGALSGAALWRADQPMGGALAAATSSGFAALDAELPGGGWPRGSLIELLLDAPGCGELSLLLPVLVRLAVERRPCLWVLPHEAAAEPAAPLPYAPALQDAGLDLASCLFVRPATARENWWSLEQALRAAHLGAAIGWLPAESSFGADFKALRRLHLLAGRSNALAFVLRPLQAATAPSPAVLRLQLTQCDGQLQLTLLKRRGVPLLEPVVLQVHPAHWQQAEVALQAPPAPRSAASIQRSPVKPVEPTPAPWRRSLQALFSH
jgi:cell division inhibitor SulA/protein ImuA